MLITWNLEREKIKKSIHPSIQERDKSLQFLLLLPFQQYLQWRASVMHLHTLTEAGYGYVFFFIKFLCEGMILCTVCSVSEYIKGENIMYFPRRIGFMCCKCLIWRNGFVRNYCQYCLFMNQNLFSNRKQLEAEHLGQESAENFATSRYCLCRGSVYLGWNTGQLWKAKWRNKLPSVEQGRQSRHKWKYRICSSRTIPFP